jgi:SAM-dependent methyltransferase
MRTATGLDLDRRVLAWGRRNNLAPLGSAARRARLLERDVRSVTRRRFDVCAAMNFSYFAFKRRAMLVSYFRDVHRSLAEDGIFLLDAYGGYEAQQVLIDRRRVGAFVYEWEQASFNPIDNSVVNHIHFRFRDGSRMFRAFTYRWRLWQLVEIQEALEEAGFRTVEVYWEEEDEDGEGTGTFRRRKVAENGAGWLALIAACR